MFLSRQLRAVACHYVTPPQTGELFFPVHLLDAPDLTFIQDMNTLRLVLVGLLLVGGIVRVATASTPERAPVAPAPAHSTICQLGQSCS